MSTPPAGHPAAETPTAPARGLWWRLRWAAWNVFWWALVWAATGLLAALLKRITLLHFPAVLGMAVGFSVTARQSHHLSSAVAYGVPVAFGAAGMAVGFLFLALSEAETSPALIALAASGCGVVMGVARELAYLLILRARYAIMRGGA
jgi:hypothetical protein